MKEQKKKYWEMNAMELAEATKEFDREIPLSETRPLSKRERAWHEKARRGPSISLFTFRIDPQLLDRMAGVARKRGLNLNQFMDMAIREILPSAEIAAERSSARRQKDKKYTAKARRSRRKAKDGLNPRR